MFVIHQTVALKVSDLNPAAYNPRKITAERFEALKESIRIDGFLEPLVVQKKGLGIIGGHQRLRAIKELCVEAGEATPEIPCILLDITDRDAKRLNIKMNKIQGEFEARMLGELLVDIYEDNPINIAEDTALLGFSPGESEKYIRLVEPDMVPVLETEETMTTFGKSPTLSLEFETENTRDRVKKLLQDNAKTAKKKSGDLVAAALGLTKKRGASKKSQTAQA
jgi:ParB-like chromosome segregation protein Spo0J